MSKHVKPQNLVLIRIQTSEKLSSKHFIKHLVCILTPYIRWNEWTWWNLSSLHVIIATMGQQPQQNHKWDKAQTKIYKKLKQSNFSQPTFKNKTSPRFLSNLEQKLRIWEIKDVRNYLRVVQDVKSKQDRLSFEEKWSFGERESWETKIEISSPWPFKSNQFPSE